MEQKNGKLTKNDFHIILICQTQTAEASYSDAHSEDWNVSPIT